MKRAIIRFSQGDIVLWRYMYGGTLHESTVCIVCPLWGMAEELDAQDKKWTPREEQPLMYVIRVIEKSDSQKKFFIMEGTRL